MWITNIANFTETLLLKLLALLVLQILLNLLTLPTIPVLQVLPTLPEQPTLLILPLLKLRLQKAFKYKNIHIGLSHVVYILYVNNVKGDPKDSMVSFLFFVPHK